jgi:uncharacterized protein YcbK (DUF882 family)
MKLTFTHANPTVPGWKWPNFQPVEFLSPKDPIKTVILESEFLDRLQALRTKFGRPLVLNSGYRSPQYNSSVSNTGLHGAHTTGRAVDIKCIDSQTRFQLIKLAIELGFTGIGIAKTFIHLDDVTNNPKVPRPMSWLY